MAQGKHWNNVSSSLSHRCYSLVNDTNYGQLLVGGDFSFHDSLEVNGILTWAGKSFAAMNKGIYGQATRAFSYYNDSLYAGGSGNHLNEILNIGQWGGNDWIRVPRRDTNYKV